MLAVAPPNIWRFRSRFGEFAKINDADVQGMLDDAVDMLDETKWNAHDYPLAVLYLAAHNLAVRQPALAGTGGGLTTDTYVRSVGFGERRVMYGERNIYRSTSYKYGPGEALYELTPYGQRYLQLLSRNFPGIMLI